MRYTLMARPPEWVSAHRKNEVKLRLPVSTILTGVDDGDGFLKITLSAAFTTTPTVGDRFFIPVGTDYTGYHTIKTVHSSIQFTLTTTYTNSISGAATIWFVYLPTVRIYAGYADNELILPLYGGGSLDLYDIMPRTLIGEFAPEPGADGYILFDINGYLRTAIETPYKGLYNEDEDSFIYPQSPSAFYVPKNYNKVEVMVNNGKYLTLYVANSSITTAELNRHFVTTGRQMQPLTVPVNFPFEYANRNQVGEYIYNKLQTKIWT